VECFGQTVFRRAINAVRIASYDLWQQFFYQHAVNQSLRASRLYSYSFDADERRMEGDTAVADRSIYVVSSAAHEVL